MKYESNSCIPLVVYFTERIVSFLIFVSLKVQMIDKCMTKSETSWYMKKKISFIDGLAFQRMKLIENVSLKSHYD